MTPRQARKPLPPGRWQKAATETHMVSDQGQVWSLPRQRLLVGVLSRRGYQVVSGGSQWRDVCEPALAAAATHGTIGAAFDSGAFGAAAA